MSKDIIRENSHFLVNPNYKKMSDVYKNSSGGSTGEPLEFYQTKDQSNNGMGSYLYSMYLNKINIYESSVDLWGALRDMHEMKSTFSFKFFVKNSTVLNTFILSDDIIENYIQNLNKIRPKYIKAYVHSIYAIAKFINKNKIKINFTPVVQTTTGPLYPEIRTEIKKAFNDAHVYNFYGSREGSAIASEIYDLEGLFVFYNNVFVEILDDNDVPVDQGVEGNIVITTLNNFYMPLIRYKIGDRGIKGDDCEFGTLKLDNVTGRTLGVIHKRDKTRVDGQFFTSLFFNKDGIKNFQIIQKSMEVIEIKIVKSSKYSMLQLNEIVEKIENELGDVKIHIEFKDQINLTATGKIMYVYSELDV
ncbi:hypothetical protein [Gelidibacter mesophilus]|uniref:hypothetical protein n=1 Tax=Gelidibacter mesophilus TaxID=169050 RepID=UPI0012F9C1DA|nr:hypothetical protein [Gelidibacter mesophilus]